jgi:serine phosphatase RsbU (regulator of sigma subunit)
LIRRQIIRSAAVPETDRDTHEDVMENWRDVQAVEDEMLQHVKDIAQRISARVRNVLGESGDDDLLLEMSQLTEPVEKGD